MIVKISRQNANASTTTGLQPFHLKKVLTQTCDCLCSSSVFFVAAGQCKVFVVAVETHSCKNIDPSFVYP